MTRILAAGGVGLLIGAALWSILDPPVRLTSRVTPYLGRNRALELSRARAGWRENPRTVLALLAAMAAERLGRLVDGLSTQALGLRLRQAGMFQDSDDPVAAYRLRQLVSVAGGVSGGAFVAVAVGMRPTQVALFAVLGCVIGGTRQRGRLEREIERRRGLMSIEIYTINHLLAMRVRTGGGVIGAVSDLATRGRGEVVGELREALRLHRSGITVGEAFRRLAEATPEPSCARTYAFLALADEHGSDLADALMSLAEDVREGRREAIRRSGAKRRAAMLVPTITVLAPVMLLFVGAPLPSLIFGFG